jgi:uncharacterized protein
VLNGVVTSIPTLIAAGVAIGLLYGLFGVGSAFATPLLAMLGVPALAAVASPLPALLPGSAAGAATYRRAGLVDRDVATRTLIGAVPACILGAAASHYIGGAGLLALSGLVLTVVGARILCPVRTSQETTEPELVAAAAGLAPHGTGSGSTLDAGPTGEPVRRLPRRDRAALVCGLGALVGFVAGLLANGGGFLLVPLFLLALGLTLPEATATSLVVATVLTIPTVATHALIGDINWAVALPFMVGLVPASVVGARCAPRIRVDRLQSVFGVLLMAVGGWFLIRQLRVLGLI